MKMLNYNIRFSLLTPGASTNKIFTFYIWFSSKNSFFLCISLSFMTCKGICLSANHFIKEACLHVITL